MEMHPQDAYRPNDGENNELWRRAIGSLESMSMVALLLAETKNLTHEEKMLATGLLREAGNLAAALKELRILNAKAVSSTETVM